MENFSIWNFSMEEWEQLMNKWRGENGFLVALRAKQPYIDIGFLAVGVVCNTISIIVLCNIKPVKAISMCMMTLAVMDTLTLSFRVSRIFIVEYRPDLVFSAAYMSTKSTANWILVLIAIERFTAVWFPFKVNQLFTVRSVSVIMGVGAILLMSENIVIAVLDIDPSLDLTILTCIYLAFAPCILLLVFNSLTVIKLRQIRRRKTMLSCSNRRSGQTKMVIAVTVAFIVLVIPFLLSNIYGIVFRVSTVWTELWFFISENLFELNHIVNFFMYFLSGKMFRRAFRNLCCKCFSHPP